MRPENSSLLIDWEFVEGLHTTLACFTAETVAEQEHSSVAQWFMRVRRMMDLGCACR